MLVKEMAGSQPGETRRFMRECRRELLWHWHKCFQQDISNRHNRLNVNKFGRLLPKSVAVDYDKALGSVVYIREVENDCAFGPDMVKKLPHFVPVSAQSFSDALGLQQTGLFIVFGVPAWQPNLPANHVGD